MASGASMPSVEATKGWNDSRRVSQMDWYLRRFADSWFNKTFSGSWARVDALSRLVMRTSIIALVPRSKRPRMAMSPRSCVVGVGVGLGWVGMSGGVVVVGVSWWMCWPVGMADVGVLERLGSMVMADGGKISVAMASISWRISL